MSEIILTAEQAKILFEARENVVLRDEAGTVRIVSEPFDAAALASLHHRKMSGAVANGMSGPRFEELLKVLEAEKQSVGKIDATRVKEIVARFRAENAA